MRAGDITRRSEIFAAVVLLLFLVLVGAAVNVPVAVILMRSRTAPIGTPAVNLRGAAAPPYWPSTTPHATPWPKPDLWQEWWGHGFRQFDARSGDEPDKFVMQVKLSGWPLPVIEVKQMWWNTGDPSLSGVEQDPAPCLLASGLIVNPLLFGIALWCVLVLPVLLYLVGRRAWRLRGGCCAWCGYQLGNLYRCPECGREARRRRNT